MESRLTVHMLDYLLEHRFASKKALASRLDISYRALLRIYQGQSSRYDIQNIMYGIATYCLYESIPPIKLFRGFSIIYPPPVVRQPAAVLSCTQPEE